MTTAQKIERAFFLQMIREIDEVQGKIRLPKVKAKKAQLIYTKWREWWTIWELSTKSPKRPQGMQYLKSQRNHFTNDRHSHR